MSSTPRISVVTPSFNQVAFIRDTLRSVLDQGYPELDYVVVDGGSTDGSADVIREYQDQLAWWVSEPDRGHPDAINKGFAHTSGEIMCWINSSDAYYPWTLATVAEIFAGLPQVEWIMGVPSELGLAGGPKKVAPAYFNIYDILAGRYRWIQQESVFWRRSLWERAGGKLDESKLRVADFDLWLRFLRLSPLYHVETVLGAFRNHDDRLGDQADGRYESEAAALLPEFAASFDDRTRRRGRLVRTVARDRRKLIGQTLHAAGAWPWYRHPRIGFDFALDRWVVR
ncbi:MAG TPA: glycosyltransferase family 2 protein [Thermoleophilia bacterium]|nr:glycosyltransferase family 2 protein [Thermoleophilia bacterium]